jgi:secreted trypsin-like serine protease
LENEECAVNHYLNRFLALAAISFLGCNVAIAQQKNLTLQHIGKHGSQDYWDEVNAFLGGKNSKIVGGKVAPDGAYPWQVSLVVSWAAEPRHFCGGSIFNERWIITAAHCVSDLDALNIHVVAGTNVLNRSVNRINVQRIIVHRLYNSSKEDNDIALLELKEPLVLGEKLRPIKLPSPEQNADLTKLGNKVVVTGWGATQEGGKTVRDLRFVEVEMIDRKTCSALLSYGSRITANMICAGFKPGMKDSCQGDSGGPLAFTAGPEPILIGVVSWGEGCARPDKYGIYTHVANYVKWVSDCVNGSASCNRP